MDITEFLKGIASQSFGAVLAYIFFKAYQKEVEDNKADWKQQLLEEKSRTEMILTALINNTVAITKNTSVVESFHRRVDHERGERT